MFETARFEGSSGLWKATPSSKTHPQNLGPFLITTLLSQSVFFLLPFGVCGTNPVGMPAPKTQNLSPRISTGCVCSVHPHPAHTHTFPALSSDSTTIYSALSPSLINLACQFKPFPFCCTDSFNIFFLLFLKERGIFQDSFRQLPISPFPSPPVFRLAGLDP